jgi:predicted dehydrogenase
MSNLASAAARRTGPVGIGLIGAGMISDTYLASLTSFPDVRVLIVGDINPVRAEAQARKHNVEKWGTPEDVLSHPDVELIVNLTIPAAHIEVASAALAAGKHVWTEKPLSVERVGARKLLDDAATAGLLVGVAPDTAYGPGLQTVRRVIERGDIGTPLSAQTVIQYPGPQMFHPNPEFLFAAGAGPLFDIGPYYLTVLVHLFGPVASVAAVGSRSLATRTIETGDRAGTEFPVTAYTHVGMVANFARGAISQSVFSFESPLSRIMFEVTGTEGTLSVPDPNQLTGPVRITRPATFENMHLEPEWISLPVADETFSRGAGALDLARCIRNGGTPIASGALGYHVLDIMASTQESVEQRRMVQLTSTTGPIPMLPEGWNPYESTL